MASPVLTMVAGGLSAFGTIAEGNAQYAAAKAERKQLNRMASEELAVATRGMAEKAREAQLLQSRGQAVAASSGGKATDNSVLEVLSNIAKDANVQQRDILRTGQVKADDLMYRGKVGVVNAKANRSLSRLAGLGTIMKAGAEAAGQWATAGGGTSGSASGQTKPWYYL